MPAIGLCSAKNYARQKTFPGKELCLATIFARHRAIALVGTLGILWHFILVISDKEILRPAALIKAAKLAPASMPAPAAKLQAATRCANSAKLPTAT